MITYFIQIQNAHSKDHNLTKNLIVLFLDQSFIVEKEKYHKNCLKIVTNLILLN